MPQFQPFTLRIPHRLLVIERPQVMGIVNVTPDSFFAGSRTSGADDVRRRVEQMIADGADMIDIGAYSSRPGADDVSPQEEIDRLAVGMEAIRAVSEEIPVSVDTFRADVAREAVERMGADIINDISGGALDSRMLDTVARLQVPYILMHMRGTPATMQQHTCYPDGVTAGVIDELSVPLGRLEQLGVSDVIIDPGFGFSKTLEQNYQLLHDLKLFELFHRPVLVGFSRKSMVTKLLGVPAEDALNGTTVLNTLALDRGASILRVHDVKAARQAIAIFNSMQDAQCKMYNAQCTMHNCDGGTR